MKSLFTSLFLIFLSSSLFAELRVVKIQATPIYKSEKKFEITGHKFSLLTGHHKDELKNIDLKALIHGIKNIEWWGSVIDISVYSKTPIPAPVLSQILKAVSDNPHSNLVSVEINAKHPPLTK